METHRYHIIIDLSNVATDRLNDTEGLNQFLRDLPGKIDMKILHGPTVIEGIPANPGLTGFVIIDFSHISAHTFTASGQVFVDIFSCKVYDQDVAMQAVLDFFNGSRENAHIQVVHWG